MRVGRWTVALCLFAAAAVPRSCYAQFDPFGNNPNPKTRELVPVPRELKQHLERARAAVSQRDYDEAFGRLDELLKSEQGDFFLPAEDGEAGSIKTLAMKLIAELDAAGRDAFNVRYGQSARIELDQAVARRDLAALDTLSRRYPGTDAGVEALLMAARLWLDRGAPVAAAVRLERLRRDPAQSRRFEPELTLLLAFSWTQADQRPRARQILEQFTAAGAPKTVQLRGQQIPWFEGNADIDTWMDQWLVTDPAGQTGEPPAALRLEPSPVWRLQTAESSKVQTMLESIAVQYHRDQVSAIPVLQPQPIGPWLVMRSPRRVFGLDVVNGKRIWSYPPKPDKGEDNIVVDQTGDTTRFLTDAGREVHLRTWSDRVYGSMASDGNRLFFVDELSLDLPIMNAFAGNMIRSNTAIQEAKNSLIALDMQRQGAIAWVAGGEFGKDESFRDAFFLGAPVCDGDNLYVLLEQEQQVKLAAMDAATGALRWRQSLVHVDKSVISADLVRRFQGVRLHLKDGMLVCATEADYVFAVDLADRRLAWQFRVGSPEGETQKDDIHFNQPQQKQAVYYSLNQLMELERILGQSMPGDHWADTEVLSDGAAVLITPRNSNDFYCLDLFTGELLWQHKRGDFVYAACLYRGAALMIGRYRTTLLRLADGEPVWTDIPYLAIPSSGIPCGRGLLDGDHYLLPTTTGDLVAIDLGLGRASRHAVGRTLGNLSLVGNLIVSQSATEIAAFAASGQAPIESPLDAVAGNDDARTLVSKLGDDRFQAREEAEKQLVQLGAVAMEALHSGIDGNDPEIRVRCRRILETIHDQIRVERLIAFRKGDPDNPATLPGWDPFKAVAGESKESRALYADMYEEESRLLDAAAADPQKALELLNERCAYLQNAINFSRTQLGLASVTTVIFLVATDKMPQDATADNYASTFCYQNSFRSAVEQDGTGPVLKRILIKWMERATESNNYNLITIGLQYELKECLPIAREMVKKKLGGTRNAYPILAVAKFGSKEDAPLLAELLDDKSECSRYRVNNVNYVTEVRDVALVALIHLDQKDPKDFGFERIQANQSYLYALHTLGFENQDERDKAFQKWDEREQGPEDKDKTDKDGPEDN